MPLIFNVDVESIAKEFESLGKNLKDDLVKGVENLAILTHAKVLEQAKDQLHSSAKLYMDNVTYTNPEENVWVVTLKSPALWIEEGRKSGFMNELLQDKNGKGQVKTSKDGNKYRAIPFEHSKGPTQQTPNAQEITTLLKTELKKRGISYKKLELDEFGSPRIGRLHSLNIESPRPSKAAKNPALMGVNIYQNYSEKTKKVERSIFTFRVISERHEQENLWQHPGFTGKKFFEAAFSWAVSEWESKLLPAILEKYK